MTNVKLTPAEEGAAVRMMLGLGIPAEEVAQMTSDARKRRDTPAEQWYAIRSTPLTPKGPTR